MKELQVTLYDIFGYLIPGVVAMGAIASLFLAIYFPKDSYEFDLRSLENWLVFSILAYIGGHMLQGVANWFIPKWWGSVEEHVMSTIPGEIKNACRTKANLLLGGTDNDNRIQNVSDKWLYQICDDVVIRSGKIGERDVYVYREGFYRGCFIGFALFTIGLLFLCGRLWFGAEKHTLTLGTWTFNKDQVFFVGVLSALSCILSFRRYWRFAAYRITQSVVGFLTIAESVAEKKPSAGTN